jgi:SAM-dependent methyltransferase
MTKQEAEAVLQNVEYWHYPFNLPSGATVPSRPGADPRRHLLRKKHFFDLLVSRYSGSLQGKTVLDLGCCQGFWSFHAASAGAQRCDGIDSSEIFVSQAQALAVILGIQNCDFRCRQLEKDRWWEDQVPCHITLMLGLFYHLLDPIFVLRKAADLTLETLVVDTRILPNRGMMLGVFPRDPGEPTTRLSNVASGLRLVPTRKALLSLILDAGFDQIECVKPHWRMPLEYHTGRRITVIASKRTRI